MSNIEYLRAKALAFAPTFRYPLCLDEGKRAAIDEAAAVLGQLHAERARLDAVPDEHKPRAKSISAKAPGKLLDERIADAEAKLQAAEDAAGDEVLILVWRRLAPDAYDDVVASCTKDGRLDLVALYPALVAACWHRAESFEGEDVGLSWDEARGLLNNADRDAVHVGVLNLNRAKSAIPFSLRSSGVPGTSSEPA